MTLKSTESALSHSVAACACGLALLGAAGAVFADGPSAGGGGTVTAVSVTPNIARPGIPVSITVNVTAVGNSVDCNMRWDALEGNIVTAGADHKMHKDVGNSTDYTFPLAFSKPGVYTLRAHGGAANGQTASCGGDVNATLTVKEMVPAALAKDPAPVDGDRLAHNQVPPLQLAPTLKSLKQSDNTSHSGATWIDVQGTGHCSFSIATAGVAAQGFASSAATPFPMKVKMVGAPLGSHQWQAMGTGNCKGSSSATFSVN